MATRRESSASSTTTRRQPARTPEDRENQIIAQAVDLVERQIQAGTVSAQNLGHYLKLGSSREKLEQERLRNEVSLLEIKRETIASQKRVEELYEEAMQAFKSYSGAPQLNDELDDDYEY